MSHLVPRALADWFGANLPDAEPPFTLNRLTGGNSNLTYRVDDARGRCWVLRRQPQGILLATAHDVLREARVLAALRGTSVPVPVVHAMCDDRAVFGADFFVMGRVAGLSCTTSAAAAELAVDRRPASGSSLADTLAALHDVDVDAVGLGTLGRREGYVHRQLHRWHGQWQARRLAGITEIDEAFELLRACVPQQSRTSLVHGDFRLDNCILGTDGTVRAVLDWEICALGDPLTDLGVLLAYWAEPGDEVRALHDPPTAIGGFSTRDELRSRYLRSSGLDEATDVSFYVAFAWWKLACIVAGVAARVADHPTAGRDAASYVAQLHRIAAHAAELARAL